MVGPYALLVCKSPLESGPAGPYCPFAPCPTCKVDPSPLRGEEPERWRRLRQTGRLAAELEAAGLPARL